MFRDDDPYSPTDRGERSDFEMIDELGAAGGRAVVDVLSGRGVAPICEMRDPDLWGKHPAREGVDRDELGLRPPGVAEPEEESLSLLDDLVADAADSGGGAVEAEMGPTSEATIVADVDELVADAVDGVLR